MQITMVKKRLADGSDCRKCEEATEHLRSRGLFERIDRIVIADEADPESEGMLLGKRHEVERAPFFIVHDDSGDHIYTSVLRLIQERLGEKVTQREIARGIDPDDVGGI